MKVYCLTHDGLFRNLIVTTHDGREAAKAWLASSKKVGGEVVANPDDLKNKVSGTTMVILHTTLAKIANSYGRDRKVADVTKFESRSVGARRCFELIEELYQNQAPEAAAPPKADEVAATTTTNEDEMAKGKKTKKVKAAKAPREKKAKVKKDRQYKAAVVSKGGEKAKATALEMIQRKSGATAQEIADKLELSLGSAKNLVWYLRRDGHKIVVDKTSDRKPYVIL